MEMPTAVARALVAFVAAGLSVVSPAIAAAPIDLGAIRTAANASVCRVTVENAWGIPVAVATGFVLGDGRFVVTDLASVARPGAAKVVLRFQDGTQAAAREFGMADPAVGLAALKVESTAAARKGLPLAAAVPALDGSALVAAAGWQWGAQLEVVSGRLWKGPAIKDAAAMARIETPPGIDNFVRLEGAKLPGANGSPVLDAAGTVVAVTMEVTVRDAAMSLAMPATSLRAALLGAQPQLKALAELPKPLWPERLLRLPGGPATTGELAASLSRFRAALACQTCGGKGKVAVPRSGLLGLLDSQVPCPMCRGEMIFVNKPMLLALGGLAEQATRTVWAPGADERGRTAARAAAAESLKTIGTAGPRFQNAFALLVGLALVNPVQEIPFGVLFHAQVEKAVDGPDGRYLFLKPNNSMAVVAVRLDDLLSPGAKPPAAARKAPTENSWVLVAGVAASRFDTGGQNGAGQKGVFVLPLEWSAVGAPQEPPPGPGLGGGPGPGKL
jgi:hypothetical protein